MGGVEKREEPWYPGSMKHPGGPDWHQDQAVIKSGLNHTGSQRSRCQPCRRYFTPDPKPEGQVVSVRPQALTLDLELGKEDPH